MITLSRNIIEDYNHTVKFHVRKDAIIGVYTLSRITRVMLTTGTTIEVNEKVEEVLELLK